METIMNIYLIRHAQAIERSPQVPDELRVLSCVGRKKFRRVAAVLRELAIAPEYILTSPKLRAVQTAEILAETLRFAGEVGIVRELEDGPDLAGLAALLGSRALAGEIVLVGHEPGLGRLLSALLKLDEVCRLPKGGAVICRVRTGSPGLEAELAGMVTGGGKYNRKRRSVLDRLTGHRENGKEGGDHEPDRD
jgi:phosphohistidine phosphatase